MLPPRSHWRANPKARMAISAGYRREFCLRWSDPELIILLENSVFSQDTPLNTLTQVEDKAVAKDVGYWLLEVTDSPAASPSPSPTASPTPEVHLQAMLLGSEQQAAEIKAKLGVGGKGNDFASLAKQYSLYADAATNGGDLGQKKKGDMPAAVDQLIFPADSAKSLDKNKVYGPIQDTAESTDGGYWLFQVSAYSES